MKNKVDNSSYRVVIDVGKPLLIQVVWYLFSILFLKNPLILNSKVKVILLRLFGAKVGLGVYIKPCVNIKYPWKLVVGNHTWIGEQVWIDNLSKVTIGSNVCLSQGALLLTGSHDHTKTTFDFMGNEIVLEDGVWIGAKAIVLGGVICKSHSILGSGGVAETNLEEHTIYKGNPAIPMLKRIIS